MQRSCRKKKRVKKVQRKDVSSKVQVTLAHEDTTLIWILSEMNSTWLWLEFRRIEVSLFGGGGGGGGGGWGLMYVRISIGNHAMASTIRD
jgi:hypothetical protein